MPAEAWRRNLRAWVPRWWRGEGGAWGAILDPLLWPAEIAYHLAASARNSAYDTGVLRAIRTPIPVVSVGNLAVGGTGKTPVAAWLARRLAGWGRRPAIALRGYGEDEVRVHAELNPDVPVLVARSRREAVLAAMARDRDVAIVDDGFQHRALARDLDIVLVAAESWERRRHLLPRGPWREGPGALRRADLVVVTRKSRTSSDARRVASELAGHMDAKRIARCLIAPTVLSPLTGGPMKPLEWLEGRDVLALASLADPQPFTEQLRQAGAQVELLAFPDHHSFTPDEAEQIVNRGKKRQIVMTLKEAVKLRTLLPEHTSARVLEQEVVFEEGEATIDAALRAAVTR